MTNYPKIGIRPTIDGRQGGVRESLEAKTMQMAEAAKTLIESSLYYADGTPVQCLVASRTIGGRGDASIVDQEFASQNVVAPLTVTPSQKPWTCQLVPSKPFGASMGQSVWVRSI